MPPSGVMLTFQILDIHMYACGLEKRPSLAGLHSALPRGQSLLNLPLPEEEGWGEGDFVEKTETPETKKQITCV